MSTVSTSVKNEQQLLDELFSNVEDLEFIEINEATALPETAATSGSAFSSGCSTCGSSSTCSSST
ncbi:thiazolylpeptide-type bacteriocin [Paenibacillus profundus]|uniref:Thiazolylpeptide-type bacteriocin n=1 Tax=Paenibacillus profundus TaxID=1173085 RepID=A0ABS8YJ75_9BACL|nr:MULTISPECIES: thiazolylpeptide-type bacteriocin [Paenibacillus]MCE5170620.1 thiazolylpeptide-type bacteriocin [Paenibacillus profundus]